MDCLDENSVIDYLEGWLPERSRQEVEEHIDDCRQCRALVGAAMRAAHKATPGALPGVEGFRLAEELSPGTQIEHFQVIRALGQGSTGQVYLCRDVQLGRRVALKVVRPDALGSRSATERFLEEARTTARFSHPHIVTIHAAGVWQGLPYIALEYLEGETLLQRMERERVSVRQTLRIGLAVAEALAEAHRHGVLHRDLKPANVLLPRDGRLRVLDFSLAKVVSRAGSATRGGGTICGTPTHMAPEQWRGEEVSGAADIWALGVILYELLDGKRPFRASSIKHLGTKVIADEPVPLPESAEDIPDPVLRLVMRCLNKDPCARPSAEQVRVELERLVRGPMGSSLGPPSEQSPFRGLQPFHEEHADLFFGRDAEVGAFLERLREQGVLAVVGPSGAGKSSLVQAGVIPRLREQARWLVLQLRPGDRPFETLAARLVRGESNAGTPPERGGLGQRDEEGLARDLARSPLQLNLALRALAALQRCRVLLFVDQLEELAQVPEPEVQAAFVQALCAAGDEPHDPVRVIFTLRDDFLGRLALGPRVREALGQMTIVRSPEADALREIVTRPLELRGYRFDDEALPRRMVAEVAGEPSALPLLQFTTQLLWERRDQRRRLLLTTVYDEVGGVAGALARHADSVLQGLSAEEVGLARVLLLRLVTPDGTRRSLPRGDLLSGLPAAAGEAVLERLTRGRLVSVRRRLAGADPDRDEASAGAELELAHESLLRGWRRLAHWIDESREELAQLAELTQAAELWSRRGERVQELWRGDALHEARRTLGRLTTTAPEAVRHFVEAGQAEERGRQRRRRLRAGAGMVSLLAVAVAALVVAFTLSRQKRQAEEQRAEAQREGARAALLRGEMLEARAKLRGSLETKDSALTRLLWRRLLRSPQVWKRTVGAPLPALEISPDGRALVAASADGTLRVFDVRTGEAAPPLRGHRDQVQSVDISPDGMRAASGSWDGEVRLWELGTRRSVALEPRPGGSVWDVAFSPDGQRLAASSGEGQIYLWDLGPGQPRLLRRLRGHTAGVYGVAFSPDGRSLASGGYDRTVRLWSVAGGPARVLAGHTDTVYGVVFAADGARLASGSADRTVRIWSTSSGETLHVLRFHTAGVSRVRFSPDGDMLASASYDKRVRLWDTRSGRGLRVLEGHSAAVTGLAFTPDGRGLATAGRDHTLRLWDLDTREGAEDHDGGHRASVWGVAFSPDGRLVASGSKDESIKLREVASGRVRRTFPGHPAGVTGVAFSPDGRRLASGGGDRAVRLWSVDGGAAPQVLSGHTSEVYAVRFGPDGKRLFSAGYDRTVRIWELSGAPRQLQRLTGHSAAVYGLGLGPGGRPLASAGYDRVIRLWDLATDPPRVRQRLEGHEATVYGVDLDRTGKRLVSGSADGTVRLWDLATGKGKVVRRFGGRVYWLAFHPDGQRVGVPVSDGNARIIDLESGEEILLRGHRREVNTVSFSPDGSLCATGSDDGTVRLWRTADGRPRWWASLLLPAPPRLLSHEGWLRLDRGAARSAGAARWQRQLSDTARSGAADPSGRWLCVSTFEGQVELWDLAADRRVMRVVAAPMERVVALPGGAGCLTLAGGRASLYRPRAQPRELVSSGATALALGRPRELLVADGTALRAFTFSGGPRQVRRAIEPGVSALVQGEGRLVLGYGDGSMELVDNAAAGGARVAFTDVPASRVERLLLGPMDTLIAGYGDGLLGIWDLRTGARLDEARLHGPVVHLLLEGKRLYAASELGGRLVWDLSVLHAPYCDLLHQVWRRVPVVWGEGRAIYREPPAGHRCAR